MKLSFKDTKFIIEALDCLIQIYNERLEAIEEQEESADEASDLGNDRLFLQELHTELEKTLNQGITPKLLEVNSDFSSEPKKMSLEELINPVLQLSINERLLLVEAITKSIRQENILIFN